MVVIVVVTYLFGLSPEPVRGRRPVPGILRRRSKWRKVLPILPLLAAVGCLVLAFTGFRFNVSETSPTIVLVMDVSDSMDASDVAPNRLAAAEAAANAFLDKLPPDFRVGLATFAGDARLAVAPTQERQEVVNALGALTTSRGTVIGDGLQRGARRDRGDDRPPRTRPQPPCCSRMVAIPGARCLPTRLPNGRDWLRVPVYTVVVGQVATNGGPGANLEALQAIASTSGGKTFTAETSHELTTIYQNLGSELTVNLDVEPSTKPLVIAAIALTLLAGFMLVLLPR